MIILFVLISIQVYATLTFQIAKNVQVLLIVIDAKLISQQLKMIIHDAKIYQQKNIIKMKQLENIVYVLKILKSAKNVL